MKVQYLYSPEWKKLILSGDTIRKLLPQSRVNILNETADVIMNDADKRVHVITGQTKASGRVSIPSNNQITITYMFGAIFEERKGGSHAFLHLATETGKRNMVKIAQKYITDTVQSGITGKPQKYIRYLRKYRSPQTGRLQYEYAQGYKGGAGKRAQSSKRVWPPS